MIEISKLNEKDKEREVVFDDGIKQVEYGFISSWNDRFIFVKYNGNPQSQATYPEHLRFAIDDKKIEWAKNFQKIIHAELALLLLTQWILV